MAPSRGTDTAYPTKLVQTLDGHTGPVNVVCYNHGAKYILTGSSDRTIRLWNPHLAKEIKVYRGHAQEILNLDITHDNAKFASCGGDKTVFVWDVASGTIIRRLQAHFGKVFAVAFNKDAQVLASAGFDAKLLLWDMRANTRDPIQTLKEATSSITSLSIPDTNEIVSSSLDGQIRAYDMRMGTLTEDLVGHPVTSVVLSPNSPRETMLASSTDGKIRVFDRSNGGVLQTFKGHKMGQIRNRAVWGYGESTVLTGDDEGRIWAYNVLDGKPVQSQPEQAHKKAITCLELNPNGKELVTSSADGTVKLWTK